MKAIQLRKSVRSYDATRKIGDETLEQIVHAGRLAPSAKNFQEWQYVIIRNKEIIRKMVDVCKGQAFVGQADMIIAGCSSDTDYVMTCGQHPYVIDVSISMEHMALMAAELGVGTCWIGAFFEDAAKKLLSIPDDVRIVSLMTFGYPVNALKETEIKNRKSIDEMVCYDKWTF